MSKNSSPAFLDRYGLWLVLTLALIVRVIYLIQYHGLPEWQQLTVDANYHNHWAQRIAAGDVIGGATFFRAPLYAYLLGFLYMLFGNSVWVGHLFGSVLGAASVAMLYLLGRRVFDRRTGLIAAALWALCPVALYFEPELLVEPLFALLLLVTAERLVVWYQRQAFSTALVAGLALGLACITRPTALILAPLVLLIPILRRKALSAPVASKSLALIAAGVVIVIAPVTIRNIAVNDDPTLIASGGGLNLYIGNNAESDGLAAVLPEPFGPNWNIRQPAYAAARELGRTLTPGEVSSYWQGQALDWIADHPGRFLSLYVTKFYRHFSNMLISNNRDLNGFFDRVPLLRYDPISFALLFALAIFGLVGGAWRSGVMRAIVIGVLLIVFLNSLFFYSERFRYPLLPAFALAAGFGLAHLKQILNGPTRTRSIAIVTAVLGAILSVAPIAPLPEGDATHPMTAAGLYATSTGNYQQALQYQRAALRIDPTFPGVRQNLGSTFLQMNVLDSAMYYFIGELRAHPWQTQAKSNLAYCFLLNGDPSRAVRLGRQTLPEEPYAVGLNTILLRALIADSTVSGEDVSREAAAAADRTGNDVYFLNDIGGRLIDAGRPVLAESLLTRALESQPPPVETDPEAFRDTYRNSLPNWSAQQGQAALQLAYLHGVNGDFVGALEFSRKAVALAPDVPQGYLNCYNAYLSLGRTAEADSVLQIAARRFPNDPDVRQILTNR